MRLTVLGCGGGIGEPDRTTCFLVDEDIIVDAGTGLGALSLDQLCKIDHVFITHSHMDHIALLPILADSVGHLRDRPIRVHATEATIKVLREHVFNWQVWPDFTRIPKATRPYLEYSPITVGQSVELAGRRLTSVPANHVVPTVGYHLDSGRESLLFSGDTTTNPALWSYANACKNLRYLIVESAFTNADRQIAVASKHLCPEMLLDELKQFTREAEIFVTHTKPGETGTILGELQRGHGRKIAALAHDQFLEF